MSEKEKSEKTQAQILRDAFEGMKGRQPRSEQEVNEWLATDEGKEATILRQPHFRLGATRHGRSYGAAAWSRAAMQSRAGVGFDGSTMSLHSEFSSAASATCR